MQINPNAERKTRTIAGISVLVPIVYAEGHVLTSGEAAQMNQVFFENIGNNLRSKLAAGFVPHEGAEAVSYESDPAKAQELVDSYIASYEPGVRAVGDGTGSTRVLDPIEREARKIAKEKAVEFIKSNGLKAKDVDMAPIVDAIYERHQEVLTAEAKKIIKARENASAKTGDLMSGLESFLPGAAGEEQPQPEAAAAE